MRITKILGLLLVTMTFLSCSNAQEENTIQEDPSGAIVSLVGKAEFKKLMEKEGAQLVDVRTPREIAGGKIGDAMEMDFTASNFKDQISTLDKNKPVLIYCAAGGRSARAVKMMQQMGFMEIHELRGGYNAW